MPRSIWRPCRGTPRWPGSTRGEADPDIINPGRLSRDQQLSVCQQCHLSGIMVFNPEDDPTTYRPGELLSAHRTVFINEEEIQDAERFGISSHGVRLAQSACYQATSMTCTTCHDRHEPVREKGIEAFNASCQGCHGGGAMAGQQEALCEEVGFDTTVNCVSCHMQKVAPAIFPMCSLPTIGFAAPFPPHADPKILSGA